MVPFGTKEGFLLIGKTLLDTSRGGGKYNLIHQTNSPDSQIVSNPFLINRPPGRDSKLPVGQLRVAH